MAVATVEWLEGIDLAGAPPCELLEGAGQVPCGKPSMARISMNCSCGKGGDPFVCKLCLEILRAGLARCNACGTTNYEWRIA